jgi:hypothetical protein
MTRPDHRTIHRTMESSATVERLGWQGLAALEIPPGEILYEPVSDVWEKTRWLVYGTALPVDKGAQGPTLLKANASRHPV